MHNVRTERRQTHSDIFGTAGKGAAVLHPVPFGNNHGLTAFHIHKTALAFHPERAPQHNRIFIKFRTLPRFLPSFGAVHPGNAEFLRIRADPADKLLNDLGFVPGSFDSGRRLDVLYHISPFLKELCLIRILFEIYQSTC